MRSMHFALSHTMFVFWLALLFWLSFSPFLWVCVCVRVCGVFISYILIHVTDFTHSFARAVNFLIAFCLNDAKQRPISTLDAFNAVRVYRFFSPSCISASIFLQVSALTSITIHTYTHNTYIHTIFVSSWNDTDKKYNNSHHSNNKHNKSDMNTNSMNVSYDMRHTDISTRHCYCIVHCCFSSSSSSSSSFSELIHSICIAFHFILLNKITHEHI